MAAETGALDAIAARGLVLLGCGKMGSAMLQGWLSRGLLPSAFTVLDPAPDPQIESLAARGLRLNADPPAEAAVAVLAVKPQLMADALPRLAPLGHGATLFLSVAAGLPIRFFEDRLGAATPIVRAMPNTPAAVGRGITALVGNAPVGDAGMALAEALMSAVGQTVRLADEAQMDAVTAVSGSGPAYVFHLIETLAAAAEAEGLPPDLALTLARATVAGAGALAEAADETPDRLRVNVTSPGGTTAAALEVLMHAETGLAPLMRRAVAAAARRSRELGG
jgi:pyrroline-5-carboxylate reductase